MGTGTGGRFDAAPAAFVAGGGDLVSTNPWRSPLARHSGPPFLRRVTLKEGIASSGFPFLISALQSLDITLASAVTFLVGENGSGKSTLLEGLASAIGFGAQGGSRDHAPAHPDETDTTLGASLRLEWHRKTADGFFFRAETLYSFASLLQSLGSDFGAYGGRNLRHQSHGESFLAIFQHRFRQGIFLLDEPEAALSPTRQLAFLRILKDLVRTREAQFIIATHSPILITFAGSTVLSMDAALAAVPYQSTDQYRITRDFLSAPERYHRQLFTDDD